MMLHMSSSKNLSLTYDWNYLAYSDSYSSFAILQRWSIETDKISFLESVANYFLNHSILYHFLQKQRNQTWDANSVTQ